MKTSQLFIAMAFILIVAPFVSAACIVPNVGGTAELPPTVGGCEYIPPLGDVMQILPPAVPGGSSIDIDPVLFGPPINITEVVGGSLGGHIQTYDALLSMQIQGMGGPLAILNRFINLQVSVVTESGPRNPGDAVQTFPTEMISLSGNLFGDPDFATFSIKAGIGQAMPPAPGATQLTRQGAAGSPFAIESFFDITYEIDFDGQPGSLLQGMSGPTVGTIRLQIGNPVPEPATASLMLLGLAGLSVRRRR
jgi:hypothetical protein